MPSVYTPKPRTKIVQCSVCQEDIEVGWKTRSPKRCMSCGIKEYVIATNQIAQQWGPYYDKWQEGMRRAAERLIRTTPPSP